MLWQALLCTFHEEQSPHLKQQSNTYASKTAQAHLGFVHLKEAKPLLKLWISSVALPPTKLHPHVLHIQPNHPQSCGRLSFASNSRHLCIRFSTTAMWFCIIVMCSEWPAPALSGWLQSLLIFPIYEGSIASYNHLPTIISQIYPQFLAVNTHIDDGTFSITKYDSQQDISTFKRSASAVAWQIWLIN